MANSHFTCNLYVWVEGTTIYAQMHYYRADGASYRYSDPSFPNPTMTIAGETFTDTAFGELVRTSGVWVGDYHTVVFTKTVSANGTYGVSYNVGSGQCSDFAGTWTGSATVTDAYSAPSTPSVTVLSKSHNSVTFKVSISSYGNPGSANGRYIEAAILSTNNYMTSPRRWQPVYNTTSSNITVSNSSGTDPSAPLTITGNTRYWYGGYANNTQRSAYAVRGSLYTPCPPLSELSLSTQEYATFGTVNATIAYTRQADGGAQTRTGYYRYSVDGGATYSLWESFGTVTETTGTFTVELPTGATVLLEAKLNTGGGGDGEAIATTFTTSDTHTAPNFADFEYEDASETAVTVSGDNQLFIQGQSQPKVTIAAANAATANDGAEITSYTASLNALSIQIPYSDKEDVSGMFSANTPTDSGTLALTVAANDSLSLSTAVSKNVEVIPWAAPVLNATAERANNFEINTTLKISGAYSPVEVGGVVKNALTVAYRAKKSHESWPTPEEDPDEGWVQRPITISGSDFSAPDFALELDNESQWNIQVRAVDKFTTTTEEILVSVGHPILFVSRNKKVGVNRTPTNSNADMDVEGLIYSQDQPVMTSHVGMVIMSTTLTTAAEVKEVYGGNWTAYSGLSVSGLYCWRRTS